MMSNLNLYGVDFSGYVEIEAKDTDNLEDKFFNCLFRKDIAVDNQVHVAMTKIKELPNDSLYSQVLSRMDDRGNVILSIDELNTLMNNI